MSIIQVAQVVGLFVAVSMGVALCLMGLVAVLDALEPATIRVTHPPTRRIHHRE